MTPRWVGMSVLALAASCEPADTAVDPVWGRQACAHCGMIVGEARTAGEITTSDGTRLYFDDIGCMLAYEHETHAVPRHEWVHDANGPSWIDAARAAYVAGEHTPMDFGFVAHARGPGYGPQEVRARVLVRLAEAGSGDERGVP